MEKKDVINRDNKIVVIQRIFSHYRKPFFDALNVKYDIRLLHGKIHYGVKQIEAEYSQVVDVYKYAPGQTKCFLNVLNALVKLKPKIVIHEFTPSILSLPVLLIFKSFFGYKVILWGHGYNHTRRFAPYRRIDSLMRVLFMKWADATILYGQTAKVRISKYVQPNKLFVAQNTLSMRPLIRLRNKYSESGKDFIKRELGFHKKYNIIFIGRLLPSKFPENCLNILKLLVDMLDNQIALHFVGDGEEVDNLKKYTHELRLNSLVFFHGAIHDMSLNGKYLFAADLLLMPGHLGLCVNHALVFDSPVFSFKRNWEKGVFHAPEAEYVIEGKTGFFTDPFNDKRLSELIVEYLHNDELQSSMQAHIRHIVEDVCSLENMISGFDESIEFAQCCKEN